MESTPFPGAPRDDDLRKASALLKALIQIDTSNPPGNERPAFDLLLRELQAAGVATEMAGESGDRPNLVARLPASPANVAAPPIVLSCHLDTVPVPNPKDWKHGPFSGAHAEGCIWGRGAVDMKGFAVMALTALRCIKRSKIPLNRDLIFVAVCDEETGTRHGSRWLVENRPDLLHQPEYVINEVGGFTVHRRGRRFYPVQVAEKGFCWLRLTARSQPGHSSMPSGPQHCLSQIADVITRLSHTALPWRVTPSAKQFLESFARFEPSLSRLFSRLIFNQRAGPWILKGIPDPAHRSSVEAILRNTATPTRVRASDSINMLPHAASVDIDGRLVPGQTSEDLIRQIRQIIGDENGLKYEVEVLQESPAVVFPHETPLFRAIEETVAEMDPGGVVIPSIIPGFTDSHNYAKIGAKCYGFYPLKLPQDLKFASLFHGTDERIPEKGFHWGIETLVRLLSRFLVSR